MSTSTDFTPRALPELRGATPNEAETAAAARGYAAGYASGARAAQKEAVALRAQLQAQFEEKAAAMGRRTERALVVLAEAARALSERTVPVVAEAQDTLVGAALDLAESVIGFDLADRHGAARAALARATGQDEGAAVAVRLHPDDIAVLPADVGVPLVADPSLSPGDAVAELERGFVDARVATAVARARAALTEDAS